MSLLCNAGILSTCSVSKFVSVCAKLKGSVKEPNISIYFFFRPSLNGFFVFLDFSDVLFTGERGVSDFSVLKCY